MRTRLGLVGFLTAALVGFTLLSSAPARAGAAPAAAGDPVLCSLNAQQYWIYPTFEGDIIGTGTCTDLAIQTQFSVFLQKLGGSPIPTCPPSSADFELLVTTNGVGVAYQFHWTESLAPVDTVEGATGLLAGQTYADVITGTLTTYPGDTSVDGLGTLLATTAECGVQNQNGVVVHEWDGTLVLTFTAPPPVPYP